MVRRRFRGRSKPVGKYKSSLEKRFADVLAECLSEGKIIWWKYEPMRFRLTDRDLLTTYTPDFAAMFPDGTITIYETKGRWTSSGRIKTKLMADQYFMFKVVGVQWKQKQWKYEDFSK